MNDLSNEGIGGLTDAQYICVMVPCQPPNVLQLDI
jgi:hypothetical protein